MQFDIQNFITSLQYSGIFLLLFLLPPELIMPLVGYLAWSGYLSLTGGIIAGVIGSTVSAVLIYLLFRYQTMYVPVVGKRKSTYRILTDKAARANKWFDRHARSTVFVSRFIPGFRTIISVPAGIQKMPAPTFITFIVIGNTIWVSLLALLGYWANEGYTSIQRSATNIGTGLAIILVVYIAYRLFVNHANTADES